MSAVRHEGGPDAGAVWHYGDPMREQRRLANAGFQAPKSKPDKRARRLIQALGDLDAL